HEPRRPSQLARALDATTPPGVDRIDVDLDFITLKALRAESHERYGSVVELADDLRRFRHGMPVRARAGDRRYRAMKVVRKHRRALAALLVAFVLLSLFAIDRTIQVERRDRALEQAQRSLARSEAMWSFLDGLFWQAHPQSAKGRELTVTEAIERGEQKLVRRLSDRPDLDAAIYSLLGRIRLGLGELDEARADLRRAVEVHASLDPVDDSMRLDALRARGALALIRFQQHVDAADPAREAARATAEARAVYDESRELTEASLGQALELASPLAEIYCWSKSWPELAALTDELTRRVERQPTPLDHAASLSLAHLKGWQALVGKYLDVDLVAARSLYRSALTLYLEHEGEVHPEVANLRNQLGLIAEESGDVPDAIAQHEAALTVRRRLYPGGHWEIGQSLEHLGRLYRRAGDLSQTIETLQDLVRSSTQTYGETGGWTVTHRLWLCEVLIDAARPAEAEALLRRELRPERRATRSPTSRSTLRARGLLGAALHAQGDASGTAMVHASLDALRQRPERFEDTIRWFERFLAAP
ncbi:MAG: tetratricopeptide repeat protein, partial [Acidobacteriota bacterium]